jgi:The GLUG motif
MKMSETTGAMWCLLGSVLSLIVCAAGSAAEFAGGTGRPSDPFQVASPEQLISIGSDPNLWDRHFTLIRDLDLVHVDTNALSPIGHLAKPFLGVFKGNGHTIANLRMRADYGMYVGLFGCIGENPPITQSGGWAAGHVQDLHLKNVDVSSRGTVGGLAGWLAAGSIRRCSVTGTVTGGEFGAGGLVGQVMGPLGSCAVAFCSVTAVVRGKLNVGGLIGEMDAGEVLCCSSSGHVQGHGCVAGLVGTSRFWAFPVGVYESRPEGLMEPGKILCCWSDCSVVGEETVGGLVAYAAGYGSIEDCYALGPVRGAANVGGLIGENFEASLIHCYSAAQVTGEEGTGGLVGTSQLIHDPNEWHPNSPCQVVVEQLEGQRWRVGFRPGIVSCFWDIDVSKRTDAFGRCDNSEGTTGLPTPTMLTASTFTDAGWDFTRTWRMPDGGGYPRLRWEP